jgi:hypothetical protein
MSAGSSESPEHKEPPISAYIAVATAFVVLVWIFFVLLATPDERGSWADVIGSLFSGLAFVGVVAAIFLQREELKVQRQELKETKEELRRSAEANEEHASQMARQVTELESQSQHNQEQSMLQRRDQFLTARINATVALLQACHTRNDYSPNPDGNVFRREMQLKEITKLQQELAILKCEVRLPRLTPSWNKSVEAHAIHEYLVEIFGALFDQYVSPSSSPETRKNISMSAVLSAREDLVVLRVRIRRSHPMIANQLEPLIARNIMKDEDAKVWVADIVNRTLAVTNPAWQIPEWYSRRNRPAATAEQ